MATLMYTLVVSTMRSTVVPIGTSLTDQAAADPGPRSCAGVQCRPLCCEVLADAARVVRLMREVSEMSNLTRTAGGCSARNVTTFA